MATINPEAITQIKSLPILTDVLVGRQGSGKLEKVTLKTFTQYLPVQWTIDFMDYLTIDIYAPYVLKIVSVSAIRNIPGVVITVEGAAYVTGEPIAAGALVAITVDAASVINVNVEVL